LQWASTWPLWMQRGQRCPPYHRELFWDDVKTVPGGHGLPDRHHGLSALDGRLADLLAGRVYLLASSLSRRSGLCGLSHDLFLIMSRLIRVRCLCPDGDRTAIITSVFPQKDRDKPWHHRFDRLHRLHHGTVDRRFLVEHLGCGLSSSSTCPLSPGDPPLPESAGKERTRKKVSVDLWGAFLLFLLITSLLLVLNQMSQSSPGFSGPCGFCLVMSMLFMTESFDPQRLCGSSYFRRQFSAFLFVRACSPSG